MVYSVYNQCVKGIQNFNYPEFYSNSNVATTLKIISLSALALSVLAVLAYGVSTLVRLQKTNLGNKKITASLNETAELVGLINKDNPSQSQSLVSELEQFTQLIALKKFATTESGVLFFDRIVGVTKKVIALSETQNRARIQYLWGKILENINGRTIDRVGVPPLKLDCSVAIKIVKTSRLPNITCEKVNLKDQKALEAVVQAHIDIFNEFLPRHNLFPSQYYKYQLSDQDAECYAVKINRKIVGILSGFHFTSNGTSQFYINLLGRKGCVAKLGVGEKVMEFALEVLFGKKKIDHITLDAALDNKRTLSFYEKFGFTRLTNTPDEDGQIMFVKSNNQATPPVPSPEEVSKAISEHILQTIPLMSCLQYLALLKKTESLWKARYV